ncbi:MAG: hypothetical protein N2444_09570, partial [Methylocystis sp.]|nr:hypothetical protein [Methylocystis sp.]
VYGLSDAPQHLKREASRLIKLSEEHRLASFRSIGIGLLGWGMSQCNRLDEASKLLRETIESFQATHYQLSLPGYLAFYADVRRRLGDLDAAKIAIAQAIEMMRDGSSVWLEPELRRIEALVFSDAFPDESETSVKMLRSAANCAKRHGSPVLERRCLLTLKHKLASADDAIEARLDELSAYGDLAKRIDRALRLHGLAAQ